MGITIGNTIKTNNSNNKNNIALLTDVSTSETYYLVDDNGNYLSTKIKV